MVNEFQLLYPHQKKPIDLQRAVLRAAIGVDPGKRIVGAEYAHAVTLLAERGYITVPPCGDGFRVEKWRPSVSGRNGFSEP